MKRTSRGKGTRSPIGLDLGNSAVKAAQVQRGSSAQPPLLTAALTLDRLRPGQPFDVDEAVRLRDVLERRGFVGRRVVVSVPGKWALTSVLTLPPRKEGVPLDQIVRAELAHEHRCDPDGFELAWWELPRPARAAAGTHAMAVACQHGVAEGMLDVLHRAGFDVVGLDMEGWAVGRACESLLGSPEDLVASVDLGWDSMTLVLLHQGVVVYERSTFTAGVRQLRKVLEEEHQYPAQVVDYLLHDIGFELDKRGQEDDGRMLSKAVAPLQAHFDQVIKELNLSLDYAHSQYPSAQITKVLMLGGGAQVPGAAAYVGAQLDTSVEVASAERVTRGAEVFGELAHHPSLTLAIGLSLHNEGHDAKEAA